MEDPLVTVAWITLIGTCVTAVGGILAAGFYVWRRDPAGARNGTIDRLSDASIDLKNAAVKMNGAHTEYMLHLQEYDRRNLEEHKRILGALERLTDLVAPRRTGGL